MRFLVLIFLILINSCASQKIIYLKGENHKNLFDKRYKQASIQRAKNHEISLMLEGYFSEERIGNNIYGIESDKVAPLSYALSAYARLDTYLNNKTMSKKERSDYYRTITGTFFLYDKIKSFKEIKEKLNLESISLNSEPLVVKNFCIKIINYYAEKYYGLNKPLKRYLKNLANLETLWQSLVVKERDKDFVTNIISAYDLARYPVVVIMGERHIIGVSNLLKDRGFDVKVLNIKRRRID